MIDERKNDRRKNKIRKGKYRRNKKKPRTLLIQKLLGNPV